MKRFVSVLLGFTLLISAPLWAGTPSLGKGCATSHTLATTDNGLVYAWGFGDYGQLGSNPYSYKSSVPVAVDISDVLSGKTIVEVANGWQHSIALASDGTVYGWGYNYSGQLGNGSNGIYEESRFPVAVDMSGVLSGKTITSIAAGLYHTLAMDSDGKAYAWGYNSQGQLGNGSTSQVGEPLPVAVDMSGVLSGKTITAMAAGGTTPSTYGDDFTVALASDGTVYAWGYNGNYGLLGNNSDAYKSEVPVAVDMSGVLSGKTITEIAAGGGFTLALASDGSVYAWGYNGNYGLLGNNSDAYKSEVPVAVDMSGVLSGKTITAIAAGEEHAVVLASDGSVYTWGRGGNGRLGDNSPTYYPANSKVPVAVDTSGVLFGKTITAVAAGEEHTVALASDGTVYGWGANDNGQLGNNSTTESRIPVQVLNSDNSKFFLLEYHIPDLSTLSVESIEMENATVNANIRDLGNPNPTQHGFCWDTSGHPSIEDSKVELGAMESTGDYSSVIDNLSGNTSYYVRAYATNTSGTAYGDILTFTTLGLPVISTVSLTSPHSTSLVVTVNLSFLGNPELSEFGICWNTSGNPSIEDTTLEIGLCPNIGQTYQELIEIDSENIYYVRAYATNTAGTAYGDILTYPILDLPVVSTLSVESIDIESATVNANISELGNPNPTEHGFCWNTSGNPNIDDSKVEMGAIESIGNYSSVIGDLLGNTLYYVRAYVTNAAGTAYGDNLTFSTLETSVSDITPSEYCLAQNYPNPFNPSTTITYQLSSDCDMELSIYDMNGKKVVTLLNENMSAGYYETNWNASDLSSGIYFYRLQTGDYVATKKMVFMK